MPAHTWTRPVVGLVPLLCTHAWRLALASSPLNLSPRFRSNWGSESAWCLCNIKSCAYEVPHSNPESVFKTLKTRRPFPSSRELLRRKGILGASHILWLWSRTPPIRHTGFASANQRDKDNDVNSCWFHVATVPWMYQGTYFSMNQWRNIRMQCCICYFFDRSTQVQADMHRGCRLMPVMRLTQGSAAWLGTFDLLPGSQLSMFRTTCLKFFSQTCHIMM